MAPKRPSSREEGNDERNRQVLGKRRYGPSELQDTRYLQFLAAAGSSSTNDMELSLERLLRKVVEDAIPSILEEVIPPILEEVIPPILQRYMSPRRELSLNRQIGTPGGGRSLQFCFMNRLPLTMFTLSKITAENGSPLQIALCDTTIQPPRVKQDSPPMKVQLCVLKGDFGSEDWTAEEFDANILSQRKEKPPLLSGDLDITLENGVGHVKNVEFTDNSSWTKSSKFRIGIKVKQSTSVGADIKEGRSEPLRVKDKRGVPYEKRNRPSLNDKVWRLHKIAKDGAIHKQLSLHGIETVKDLLILLQLCTTNQASLRQNIGNIPEKSWEKIIEHARACEIDDDMHYTYQCFAAEQSISLVLNCIYQVVGVSFNGQNVCPLESLNSEDKRLVEMVKREAYNNLGDLKPIVPTPHSMVLAALQWGAPDLVLQQFYPPNAQQGQQPQLFLPYLSQPSTSKTSQHIDEAAHSDQVGASQVPQLAEMQLDWPAIEQLISGAPIADNGCPISGPQIDPFIFLPTAREPLVPFPCYFEAEPSNAFLNSAVYTSSKGKRKTVWNKIRSAFKWAIMHAAKRKGKVLHSQY